MADSTVPTIAYSDADAQQFIADMAIDPDSLPPWGRVWTVQGRQILVWVDTYGRLHVIDITSHPIGAEIDKAPYHTDDESFLNNLYGELDNLSKKLPSASEVSGLLALGVVAGIALLVAR